VSYYGSFHATDIGRRDDRWPMGPVGPGGPNPNAPKPKPAPRPGPKKPYVRPDQGMPVEMVICTGTPQYILPRFEYNKWNLRDDLWERHRCMISCIARDVVASWSDTKARKIHHICLMGHADFHGPGDYNLQLGRARANSVRTQLCKELFYHANCHHRPDILPNITIAAGTAGDTTPRDPGRSDEARARNRRVEVFFVYQPTSDGRKCVTATPIPTRPPPRGGVV